MRFIPSRRHLPPVFRGGDLSGISVLFDIVEQRKRNAGGACPGGFAVKLLVLIKGGLWSGTTETLKPCV